MEKMNSYMGLAENDFLYAKNGMEFCKTMGNFNPVAAGCAQAAEKYLKAVIELAFPEDEDAVRLLRSHNLRAILNKIKGKYEVKIDDKECKWLGDFYFDARYPGDNFVETTEEDAVEALRILEQIRREAQQLVETEREKRKKEQEKLKEFKAF